MCLRDQHTFRRRKIGIMTKSMDPKPLIMLAEQFGWNNVRIAREADVNVRRVYDWKNSKMKISTNAADNLCMALGTNLEIVYPYE